VIDDTVAFMASLPAVSTWHHYLSLGVCGKRQPGIEAVLDTLLLTRAPVDTSYTSFTLTKLVPRLQLSVAHAIIVDALTWSMSSLASQEAVPRTLEAEEEAPSVVLARGNSYSATRQAFVKGHSVETLGAPPLPRGRKTSSAAWAESSSPPLPPPYRDAGGATTSPATSLINDLSRIEERLNRVGSPTVPLPWSPQSPQSEEEGEILPDEIEALQAATSKIAARVESLKKERRL
jgi:hypothetical protein